MRISDWSSDVCSSDLPCSSSPRASIVIDWTVPSRSPSSWCVSQRASYRLPTLSAIPPLCMHHPQPTPDLIDRSRADHILLHGTKIEQTQANSNAPRYKTVGAVERA